jgi:hypothetical protein
MVVVAAEIADETPSDSEAELAIKRLERLETSTCGPTYQPDLKIIPKNSE